MADLTEPAKRTDLGSAICPADHKNRIHPLGGGMFVCFECLVGMVTGRKAGSK